MTGVYEGRVYSAQDRLNLNMYLIRQIHLLGVPVNEVNNNGE